VDPDQLLTTDEAAALLRIGKNTLRNMRTAGKGPRAVRIGEGRAALVRYRRQEIAEWIEKNVERTVGTTRQ
jgi:excisionase family DNA binding protein